MTSTTRRGRGRPRAFDIGEALDRAIAVFRERGYHATTVADLKVATALASGSIYKAFKDKRAVFLAAFERYVGERDGARQTAQQGLVRGLDQLRAFLGVYVQSSSGEEGRRGCLVVGSTVELATFDPEIAQRVQTAAARNEIMLARMIRLGQSDGSIPIAVDPGVAARTLFCLTQGMRVAGKTGRTAESMQQVVDLALQAIL